MDEIRAAAILIFPGCATHEHCRCDLLGIRVTQSNARNLSVSHRDSISILERIVGPKE